VFHVELRQFPNSARLFNLTRAELDAKVLQPWVAGRTIEIESRRWSPDRAKLTVLEGRRLEPGEIGLGRGWGNAARTGADVTEQLLEELAETGRLTRPVIEALKGDLGGRAALSLQAVLLLAGEHHPGWRVSERLALAETAIWELLHQGRLRMVRDGAALPSEEWEGVLLSWAAWTGTDPAPALLEPVSAST
jgi:hypothetical protein